MDSTRRVNGPKSGSRAAGDPANSLGQEQLVYDPPRSIHGTNDSASRREGRVAWIDRAHNSVVKALARQLWKRPASARMRVVSGDAEQCTVKQTGPAKLVRSRVD